MNDLASTAKEHVKSALRLAGRMLPRRRNRRVVVLCYHSIHPSLSFRTATPDNFADHLSWLREHCECVPFSVAPSRAFDRHAQRPVVSVTFDDGYADNHEVVLPLLLKNEIPATFFLTAGLLDRDADTLAQFERVRHLSRDAIPSLSWSKAREIHDAGMEVGAHGYSHQNLVRLHPDELRYELEHPKRVIEHHLQQTVTMMAYPFGRPRVHVTEAVVFATKRAGYRWACTVAGRGVKRSDDPLLIPRIFVNEEPVEVVRDKVHGVWDVIGSVRERTPLAIARAVSPSDFSV
jgi:peptidoglycan/xylan/chitin deacetylase (PgdA/CDA1 family)